MASPGNDIIARRANTNAQLASHLMFMSEVSQALADADKERMEAGKRYADAISNINGLVATNISGAMMRLQNSLDTLQGDNTEQDEDY